jgi:hypothetical protein
MQRAFSAAMTFLDQIAMGTTGILILALLALLVSAAISGLPVLLAFIGH